MSRKTERSVTSPPAPAPPAPAPTETQRRLVDAALGLFAEKGFEGATTAQIAARAGVAEKTLFANFGSKERLYQATLEPATLLALMLPEAIRTLTPVFDHPSDDLRAFLRAVIDNRLRFAEAHRREVKLLVQHLLTRPEGILAFGASFQERIAPHLMPVLQHFVERGALRGDVPLLTLVRIIVTTVVGNVLTRVILLPDLPWDDAREIDHLVSVLADGVVPREAPFAPARAKARRRARRAP